MTIYNELNGEYLEDLVKDDHMDILETQCKQPTCLIVRGGSYIEDLVIEEPVNDDE